MKKKLSLSILAVIMVLGLMLNFKNQNVTLKGKNVFTASLKNISAVQASAGEYTCAGTSNITCTIVIINPDGSKTTGSSYGPMVGSN